MKVLTLRCQMIFYCLLIDVGVIKAASDQQPIRVDVAILGEALCSDQIISRIKTSDLHPTTHTEPHPQHQVTGATPVRHTFTFRRAGERLAEERC